MRRVVFSEFPRRSAHALFGGGRPNGIYDRVIVHVSTATLGTIGFTDFCEEITTRLSSRGKLCILVTR